MRIVLYLCLLVSALLCAPHVHGQEVVLQDSFDDGNDDNWTVQRNQQWHNPDKPCMDGTQPAEWEVVDGELGIVISNGPSCTTAITPNNLDLSQFDGFEFSFDWHFIESMNMDRNVALLWQDKNNWYGVKVLGNEVRLEKVVDGRSESIKNSVTTYQFAANTHYHFTLTWKSNNSIRVLVNNEEIIATEDELPFIRNFKTIGLMASTGAINRSVSFFDNIVVKSLDKPGFNYLPVPLIKQIDTNWAHYIYDNAKDWSTNPTIGRWGCALSSMVMILHYHGIDRLPNGQLITPYTLNIWLSTQPDGYVGEGLVNWIAVTRLTSQVSTMLDTPKLEFNWQPYSFETVRSELMAGKPLIVELTKHFVAARGFSQSGEVVIADPGFAISELSQHPQQPVSLRMFQPSHTDLSYIMIVSPPEISVSLVNEAGLSPSNISQHTEGLTDIISGDKNSVSNFTLFPKPQSGIYTITALGSNNKETPLTIFVYNQSGEVVVFNQNVKGFHSFNLNYDSIKGSTLTPLDSWVSLRSLLLHLYNQHQIPTHYVWKYLDRLAEEAMKDQLNQSRYVQLLKKTILELGQFMSTESSNLLLNHLDHSMI
jgi:hypothetical protein